MTGQVLALSGEHISPDWVDELLEIFWGSARGEADEFTHLAFQLGVSKAELELRVSGLFDPQARAFIQQYSFNGIRRLADDQKVAIRNIILNGIADGMSPRDLARDLRAAFGTSERAARLATIARTEMNRAANWGRLSSWRKSAMVLGKEFIASNDDRVRESHLAADGDVVPVDEPFRRGAAAGKMSPPLDANCRCTIAPVTDLRRAGHGSVSHLLPETEEQARRRERAEELFGMRGAVLEEYPGLRDLEARLERALFVPWNEARDRLIREVMLSG